MENVQKRAYIGGRVTGLPINQVISKFQRKAQELREQGYRVIDPVARIMKLNNLYEEMGKEPLRDDHNRKEIMGICLYDLSTCDELHLLHDWQESRGATQERDFAQAMGMQIFYDEN